jgi:iron complex outermembrane receptor protein
MLFNGIPVTTLLRGNRGAFPDDAPLENIARIEIIRGPGSALYGADAYAGVINIITKNAADVGGTQVGGAVGSFDTWSAWAQHGGRHGPLDVAAFVRVGATDGHDRIVEEDAQTLNDRVFGTNASLAPGPGNFSRRDIDATLQFGLDNWRLRAAYKHQDLGAGHGVAQALDPVGRGQFERITADLSWLEPQLARDWSAGATLAYLHHQQTIDPGVVLFPPGVTFPTGTFPNGMIGAPDTWERHWRLSAFATFTGWLDHRVRLGAGYEDLDMYRTREHKNFTFAPNGLPVPTPGAAVIDFTDTAPFLMPHRRRVHYVYAQDEWQLARDWALTAGIRYDRYSDVGGTTNPRLALVWDAAYDVTIKLLYGTAFRAPSYTELYSINNPVAQGNPGLAPERIRTTEAVLAWHAQQNLDIKATLFHYGMEDILRVVPNAIPGTGATWQNTGDQTGRGLELEGVWDVSRTLRLTGNYGYQRSIDEATQQDAGYAPRHDLHGRADWRFVADWRASAQVNWVADRQRAAGDTRPPVRDYTTLDLAIGTERGRTALNVTGVIRNVFNTDVREPSLAPGVITNDLPQPGRAYYLLLTLGF